MTAGAPWAGHPGGVRGAIFDMDGTLLDSMPAWDTLPEQYLRRRGIAPEAGLEARCKTLSLPQVAEHCRQAYGLPDGTAEIVGEMNAMLAAFYTHEVRAKPGARELLQRLRDDGVVMCVATATERYMVEPALRRTGLSGYFRAVLTCSEVGRSKEHPLIFQRALAALGTERAQTLVFEDAHYAIRTARSAGFPVVGVEDASAQGERAEIKKMANYYVTAFAALE